jgi:CheY-like chemotaxis protein/HPt (histidine-containing phosphotransfer) domain-containing protein
MPNPKILAVDDLASNLLLLQELLTPHGYALDTAANAAAGLAYATRTNYALLLFDIQLPDFNGDVLLNRLRGAANAASQHAPAFALTGELTPQRRAVLKAGGFAQVFAKPWSLPTLLDAIAQIADSQRAGAPHTALSTRPALPDAALDAAQDAPPDILPNALFDETSALKTVGGDITLMHKLRAMLIADLHARAGHMRTALAAGDFERLAEHRHKLAGAAAFTGAVALGAALNALKDAPNAASFSALEHIIERTVLVCPDKQGNQDLIASAPT